MSATRTINSGGTGAGTATLNAGAVLVQDGNQIPFDFPPLYFSQSPCQKRTVDFASGVNTLALHADTRLVAIIPRAGNAVAWTVRKSGDTGWEQNLLGFYITTLGATTASIEVNCGAIITDVTVIEL